MVLLLLGGFPGAALAFQAGLRQIGVAAASDHPQAITVALFYPTQAPASAIPMGPYTLAQMHRVDGAWHLAFVDAPSYPIPTEDGDLGADPPGFDRSRFHDQLDREIADFFDAALH